MFALHPQALASGAAGEVVRPLPANSSTAVRLRPGVLIVDDEAFVRAMLRAGLTMHGFAVFLAAGGSLAAELYQQHRAEIGVALVDRHMPGMDGIQTMAALREIDPRVRCCLMSGDADIGGDGKSAGVAYAFPKPFHLDDLAHRLWQLVTAA